MGGLIMSFLAAIVLLWEISCSSSNTHTASTTGREVTDTAAGAASSQAPDSTSFPVVVASSDMFEIRSSAEARTKASHAEVKKFAELMIRDHNQISTELKAIADNKHVLLPAAPLPMHQRMIAILAAGEAGKFDQMYMEQQVMIHQTAVSLFEMAVKSETDPELQAFARKHLPTLRLHLDMARDIKVLVD
jgi:putative membrane protein